MKIPAIPIHRPAMAPWMAPSSLAREVPTAWLAVPRLTPTAIGSWILVSFMNGGARIAPRMPVMIIMAAEMAGMPPNWADRSMPMAVVMAFGIIEIDTLFSRWKSFTKKTIERSEVIVPARMPKMMALRFALRISSCS